MSDLLQAARDGDLELIQRLLRDGVAGISERDILGCTALLCAAESGGDALVRWLLIAGGASITEVCNGGSTALMFAALGGNTYPLLLHLLGS
jgi:ankyrin repeat protein